MDDLLTTAPARLALWALGWLGSLLDTHVFMLGEKPVTVATLAIVLASVVFAFWISSIVQRRLNRELERHGVENEGAVAVGARFAHYLIVVIGLGIGLGTAGIDLSALFAAGAVFAIAIGFAVQNVAQNFVSGAILLVEGAIKPGDVLVVNGEMVKVARMGIRSTVARTMDDIEVILPNSVLVTSAVENLTMSDRYIRIRVQVGVTYSADPHLTQTTLMAAAKAFEDRAQAHEPRVLLTGFGSSSVDWEVSIWTSEPWRLPGIASALRLALWDALKQADLVISFPQLDVHVDAPLIAALRGAA